MRVHLRQRPEPVFGSTDGALVAVGGSTDGVPVVAGGSMDGVPVAVGGSTDGAVRAEAHGSIGGN
jgi:hypothetical protein